MESKTLQLAARECLIRGAEQGLSAAGYGGQMPSLEASIRTRLVQLYGEGWVAGNEDLIGAMLAFVDDLRVYAGAEGARLKAYFQNDPVSACLWNICACIDHMGAATQPTLDTGKADMGAFASAFGSDGIGSPPDGVGLSKTSGNATPGWLSRAGTPLILMFAVSFGLALREGRAA